MSLKGKRILIGITGGIAAYKVASLIRLLVKQGAEVKVIMTASALDFITPLTISTLSKNPVYTDLFDKKTGEWFNHVDLGIWADLMLIAPLSANTLAKMAHGLSDSLLLTTYLSARCEVMAAPAMDLDMYKHPSVTDNLETLENHGVRILDAGIGELASGLSGQGRMMEPEDIFLEVSRFFQRSDDFLGKLFLITAGPTQEAIDPVRYISNHSSGKMGVAIAQEAASRGAKVNLILGPTQLQITHPNIEVRNVRSADEMFQAAEAVHGVSDYVIFSAAVADYKPVHPAQQKIKKADDRLALELDKNIDIAKTLGSRKRINQLHIGFALETENEAAHAQEKLKNKNFDFIVLNSLQDEGAGFQKDTNKVTYFFSDSPPVYSDTVPKTEIARQILDLIKSFPHKTEKR